MPTRSQQFLAMLQRSRQSIKEGKGLSEKEFWEAVRKRVQKRTTTATARRPRKPSAEYSAGCQSE
jgi:hypothetical protein